MLLRRNEQVRALVVGELMARSRLPEGEGGYEGGRMVEALSMLYAARTARTDRERDDLAVRAWEMACYGMRPLPGQAVH